MLFEGSLRVCLRARLLNIPLTALIALGLRLKVLKQVTAVMRSGARLRVILHRAHGATCESEACDGAVKERAVCLLYTLGQVHHHKAVILARDLYAPLLDVEDRVVCASVPLAHFFCARP